MLTTISEDEKPKTGTVQNVSDGGPLTRCFCRRYYCPLLAVYSIESTYQYMQATIVPRSPLGLAITHKKNSNQKQKGI